MKNECLEWNGYQGEPGDEKISETSDSHSATDIDGLAGEIEEGDSDFNCQTFFTDNEGAFIIRAKSCLKICKNNRFCSEEVVSNYKQDLVKKPSKNFLKAGDIERLKMSNNAIKYIAIDLQKQCGCENTESFDDGTTLLVNPRNIEREIQSEVLLKEAYYSLDKDERFIFYCCVVEGYNHATIGKHLGISANAVSKRFSHIREKVYQKFGC